MSHKVTAYVADGSLVSQHPEYEVDRLLGRSLKWHANNDRVEAGSFYQQSFTAKITEEEAEKLKSSNIENIYVQDLVKEAIERGIEDVANGNVSSLGSFAQYADIEIDD